MAAATNVTLLFLPGLGGSDHAHWQTYWEQRSSNCRRVLQRDWLNPQCTEWVACLQQAVAQSTPPVVLVAHSLGCVCVAHWAQTLRGNQASHRHSKVKGALLVAPADVESPTHTPPAVRNFSPIPLQPLPFTSMVLASANDPYVSITRAQQFAHSWRSHLVNVGDLGHINAASALGHWPQGYHFLEQLLAEIALP